MNRGRRGFTAAVLIWLALAATAQWIVPRLIRDAYRGDSLPVLNRMISGQRQHSVDEYVQRWNAAARPALLLLAAAGLLGALLTRPGVQRRLAAWLTRTDTAADVVPVLPEPRRLRWIYALIFVFLGGSLFELILNPPLEREHWPFSTYPMYSRLRRGDDLVTMRAFGITAENPSREFPIVDKTYMLPLDNVRLWLSFSRMNADPDRERLLRTAFQDILRRYDAQRLAGRHDGPPLKGMRLYRLRFRLDPSGLSTEPKNRELLFEVNSSTAGTPSS